ncbi:3'-5' exonuclease [Vibrio nigripulchritudo]|uniref:3'-5' exonuclease n=1 Tax=Vibrio nigripulchritudo TaxID=28173 RepID=UPI0003B1B5D3|nr:3'-5' exonuclease [Vibrio nigripulchritudo]CCN71109.1 putative DNA polymerase III subunit epsilon [Vibrio nigripulchritudo SFn118]
MSLFRNSRLGGQTDWQSRFKEKAQSVTDERLHDFYQAGIVSGDTPLSKVPFVALDFETTGLDAEKDDIVSIGLVPFNLNRIYCNQARHWIVRPNTPLQEESVVIHGITHNDILDAPDLRRVLDEVLDALAGKVVVVHYRKIEREFLDTALKDRIEEGIVFPVMDTMEIESYVQDMNTKGIFNRLKGNKRQSVRLGSSRERYGLPVYPPHHALTDAMATAELLQAQIQHHFSPDTPIEKVWL